MSDNERYRNFATEVYLDSAPENWKDIISDLHLPVFISPLHDKDVYDKDIPERNIKKGDPKKPHHHIQFQFEGKKSVKQVREIIEKFNGVGCEILGSARGYARYLCHLDNPEKAQYNTEDVICYGGLVYSAIIGCMVDKNTAIREMLQFIRANDVISYSDLVDWSEEYEPSWLDCLMNSGSYFIKEYIKSRTWKLHQKSEV